jgi:hypothetical protein
MIIAFDANQKRQFYLKADEKKASPFLIGVLDSALASHLSDKTILYKRSGTDNLRSADAVINSHWHDREVVRFGLKGFPTDFKTKDGSPATFEIKEFDVLEVGKRTGLTDESLNFVKPFIAELADAIEEDNTITEKEEKNSVTSLT